MKYMFDSNIYDFLLDNLIPHRLVASIGEIFITDVQLAEINNTPDPARRAALQALIEALQPKRLPTDSGPWDDDLPWDDDKIWRDDLSPEFTELLGNATKEFSHRDAMIGEVAIAHGLTLVTSDGRLTRRALRLNLQVISPSVLFRLDD